MASPRPEFKAEAVELVISSGHPIVQVSKENGLNDGPSGRSVREWKEELPKTGSKGLGPVAGEVQHLQAVNSELKNGHA